MGVARLTAAVGEPGKPLAAVAVAGVLTAGVVMAAPPSDPPPQRPVQAQAPLVEPGAEPEDGTVARPFGGLPQAPEEAAPRSRPVAAVSGMPAQVYAAYLRAGAAMVRTQPDCHLPVAVLAAIGKVESGHAGGGRVDAAGTTTTPILGPVLNGSGVAAIADTDGGVLDGDKRWDRAVGPMQFIPSTWRGWAVDANGDRIASPHNVFDAAAAAGRYLCAGGRDLATEDGLRSAILSYNRSTSYLRVVLSWMEVYRRGVVVSAPPPADRRLAAPPTQGRSAPAERPPDPRTPPPSDVPSDAPPGTPPEEPPPSAPAAPTEPVRDVLADLDCVLGELTTDPLGLLELPCLALRP